MAPEEDEEEEEKEAILSRKMEMHSSTLGSQVFILAVVYAECTRRLIFLCKVSSRTEKTVGNVLPSLGSLTSKRL